MHLFTLFIIMYSFIIIRVYKNTIVFFIHGCGYNKPGGGWVGERVGGWEGGAHKAHHRGCPIILNKCSRAHQVVLVTAGEDDHGAREEGFLAEAAAQAQLPVGSASWRVSS
jgi:hypothetical protein